MLKLSTWHTDYCTLADVSSVVLAYKDVCMCILSAVTIAESASTMGLVLHVYGGAMACMVWGVCVCAGIGACCKYLVSLVAPALTSSNDASTSLSTEVP